MENYKRDNKVCFEACITGNIFPSNVALEFSMQYESAVVFGELHLVEDRQEKMDALYGLIKKHFPDMEAEDHYRPITESELTRTAVFSIRIESWSGKRNWPEQATQSPDWKPLESGYDQGKPLA